MKALLIVFLWNAGELAITSEPMPDMATCEKVAATLNAELNESKYLKGMNRQAVASCTAVGE